MRCPGPGPGQSLECSAWCLEIIQWPLTSWAGITPHSDSTSSPYYRSNLQSKTPLGAKYYSELFIQNVGGGHTFPLSPAFLDWPNGRPAVRHSTTHSLQSSLCFSVDKLTLHTVDQYLYLHSETHPVKLFKLALFKQLQ